MPLGLGKFIPQGLQLVPESRGSRRLGKDAQASSASGLVQAQTLCQICYEDAPSADATGVFDRLRPIGIVEVEDRSLDERIGAAAAGGMLGIALDFGRPPHVALD